MLTKDQIAQTATTAANLVDTYKHTPDIWADVTDRTEALTDLLEGLEITLGDVQLTSLYISHVYGAWGSTHLHHLMGQTRESVRQAAYTARRRVANATGVYLPIERAVMRCVNTHWADENTPITMLVNPQPVAA